VTAVRSGRIHYRQRLGVSAEQERAALASVYEHVMRGHGKNRSSVETTGRTPKGETMESAPHIVYPTGRRAERRGDTGRSVIEAANEAVSLEEVASGITTLKRHGDGLRGRCPVHGGDNPTSFSVSPGKRRWHCHSCGEGGDAVRLAKLFRGHERDDQAAAELLLERGLEIPARPQQWFERQARQKPVRDALGRAKAQVLRKRLFRWCILPLIDAAVADPAEHDQEVRESWSAFCELSDATILAWYERGRDGS
jgi:hypothetical protein